MRALYWFREDLRLEDNPALVTMAEEADEALFVFVIPTNDRWSLGPKRMGPHRRKFMMESLIELDASLRAHGNRLMVLEGNPDEVVKEWARQYECSAVYAQKTHTTEEIHATREVAKHCEVREVEGATLIHPEDLPFEIADLPEIFTRFRKKVEKGGLTIRDACALPNIPPPPRDLPDSGCSTAAFHDAHSLLEKAMTFQGGAKAGWQRLRHYFWETGALSEYKQTRNGMLGYDYSSKFSPWLAWGCMSPRSVYEAIREYEADRGGNESTYWLIFELLWRDYFHFIAMQYGDRIWFKTGLKSEPRNPVTHHPLQWKSWCTGTTRSPFVNANMHELRLTGFMSNRGRQNVASYAIHDMGLDWRACAAWFEHWLIDFDPCSNTGNWLYVAGIGNDPRPQRKFDVDWQAERYDADGAFQAYWNPIGSAMPCDPDSIQLP
jgi:deoxyribodipyrimidine photo-lyase